MRSIEEFKELLGPVAEAYNDAQLLQLRNDMCGMAELLLDIWLSEKQSTDLA